jgi:hypothetical protein
MPERAENERCKECIWWERDHKNKTVRVAREVCNSGYQTSLVPQKTGECRHDLPQLAIESKDVSADFERFSTVVKTTKTVWPATRENEWCGQFCQSEEKTTL